MPPDVTKPYDLPTLNNDEERVLSAHETFDPFPYIVTRFVSPVGEAGQLSQAFILEHLDPFSWFNEESPHLTPKEEDTISDF